jgi:mannose-1-phosphate guanylyltransferase/mannose-6-phosphate isomerase
MKVMILCGGSGTRLWPLSRKAFPKQFLKLKGDFSFLQNTVKRFSGNIDDENIFFLTNEKQKFLIVNQLKEIDFNLNDNLVFEPVAKNTAPAIALGMKYLEHEIGIDENEVIFVTPSDHIIHPEEEFLKYVNQASHIAEKGYIVTFGITPDKPETGYGYIKKGSGINIHNSYAVERFVEKPDFNTAKEYVNSGEYFWNSGMFAFTFKTMKKAFEYYAKDIYDFLNFSLNDFIDRFNEMPEISIDYSIMEKVDNAVLLPVNIEWSDIGSWDSVYEFFEKDERGNVTEGNIILEQTKKSMFMVNNRVVASIGVDDLLVIETDDAILISKRGEAQKVKNIVDTLAGSEIVEFHSTVNRPWGSFKVLEEDERYKIKKIVVSPGERLSLQMHFHRSEHWVVVKGTAKVTIGDKDFFVHENESIYVPKTTKHSLENPGKIPLEIIEVQVGEYVGEDDIKRFEDLYGRK